MAAHLYARLGRLERAAQTHAGAAHYYGLAQQFELAGAAHSTSGELTMRRAAALALAYRATDANIAYARAIDAFEKSAKSFEKPPGFELRVLGTQQRAAHAREGRGPLTQPRAALSEGR